MYSIDNRDSFEEAIRLRDQIIECKRQCLGSSSRKALNVPMLLVGNKCDREKYRAIEKSEAAKVLDCQSDSRFIETSAKKNINIEEVFIKLFEMAKLPTEMSPSLHRKVNPSYVSSTSASSGKRGMSIRRKMSDACGTIAPNVRRPSIRTDLLVAQTRTGASKSSTDEQRYSKCLIQ